MMLRLVFDTAALRQIRTLPVAGRLTKMQIIFDCDRKELFREKHGYYEAFAKVDGVQLRAGSRAWREDSPHTGDNGKSYELVLHPDGSWTPMTENLLDAEVRTACFQIDTYSKPRWRALWSSLFDYVFVFHPGYESYFDRYQHPRVILLPHSVHAANFRAAAASRPFDLGWVGSLAGNLYQTRRRLLPLFAARYRMNAWEKRYAEAEVPEVYSQSKIVVNLSRDDYPQDANIRCFEVMASGALLVTSLPSELEQLGFENGVHFIGYTSETELTPIIDHFLKNESARAQIARRARELVLKEHTYDARVEKMLRIFERDNGALFAPARKWSKGRVSFVHFHYHCKRVNLRAAEARFRRLLRCSPALAFWGLPLFLRCCQHTLLRRWKAA
jgi:hypothetical protein